MKPKKWTAVGFGKHKGKTLPQIVFCDPDYFYWTYQKEIFKGPLLQEVKMIYLRSRSIRLPEKYAGKLVEYIIHKPTGAFGTLRIVAPHRGDTIQSEIIDMAFPRLLKGYDKRGYTVLLSRMKKILFGCDNYKMTKERCEEFFSNDENFQLIIEW